jgi:hypothetical protein
MVAATHLVAAVNRDAGEGGNRRCDYKPRDLTYSHNTY